MNILITGGAGFIGSQLAAKLLVQGNKIKVIDNLVLGRKEFLAPIRERIDFVEMDLLDLNRLEREMQDIELVFHMAANSDISQGAKVTDVDLKNGTLATYNVMEAMRKTNAREIIFASSSAIYGEAEVKPTPEAYGPMLPISFYGASKLACEALCTAFAHNYDFKVWMYRFANIIGTPATHGAVFDFVHRLKKNPHELTVLGNGMQKKSYLHVQDCMDGMLFGYKNAKESVNFFNLASHGVTEVKRIVESVCRQVSKRTGIQPKIIYGTDERGWRGDVPFTHLDGTKLQKLGWTAKYSSNEAIELAVGEIIEQIW